MNPTMAKFNYTFLFLLYISTNVFSQDFQYLIYEQYYNHYNNLRSSAHGDIYTYLQGPILEAAVNKNLKPGVKKCVPGVDSKYIVALEPDIFYNYQMTITYGQLKGKIFGPNNVLKDTFTIEIERQGKIHQQPNLHISKMYDKLVIKLEADILSKLPKNNSTINGNFCTTIELSKPKTIIIKDYKKPIQG